MANIKNGLQGRSNATIVPQQEMTIQDMLSQHSTQKRFNELLGEKAQGFMSSLLAICNNNKLLRTADPKTIISAGAMAATLDLPINQNFGFAYIVPFYNKHTRKNEAQFMMGYKGYIQLAIRTGQYERINACEVYEGEIKRINRFTGEYEFGERVSDKIIGYIAYFKLKKGFEKYVYMTIEEMIAHATKYSKSYKGGTEKWGIADFDSMAIKTVLKRLISKYGIMSIELIETGVAAVSDGAVIREDEHGNMMPDYEGTTIDMDDIEITSEPTEEEIKQIKELELQAMQE